MGDGSKLLKEGSECNEGERDIGKVFLDAMHCGKTRGDNSRRHCGNCFF